MFLEPACGVARYDHKVTPARSFSSTETYPPYTGWPFGGRRARARIQAVVPLQPGVAMAGQRRIGIVDGIGHSEDIRSAQLCRQFFLHFAQLGLVSQSVNVDPLHGPQQHRAPARTTPRQTQATRRNASRINHGDIAARSEYNDAVTIPRNIWFQWPFFVDTSRRHRAP